jgi:hypothetical protein
MNALDPLAEDYIDDLTPYAQVYVDNLESWIVLLL